MVKCDTDEADALCGSFQSRTRNVKQLCRNCEVPLVETDMWSAKYPFKTKTKIQKLVERGEVEKLRLMSQHCLTNAWYKVRFNLGNDRGIHGATPFEKLHHIDLGIFPTLRNTFFQFVGDSAELAKEINGLATQCGQLINHQSDRSMPPTNFGNGIQKGKLMAREHKGVALTLATVLVSTAGKELLHSKRRFKEETTKNDWLMLVETLLQWEAHLNEPAMDRKVVKRLKEKHKCIMCLFK